MTQTAKGNIKAIGFDVFTIFNPFSVDAVIEQNFPGKGAQLASAWRTRIFEAHTYLGSNSRDAIALANKVAGGQPTNFPAWAKANFAMPAAA